MIVERVGTMIPDRMVDRSETVREILDAISFAPSCLDMGWRWEVKKVLDRDHEHYGSTTGEPFPGIDKVTVVESGWLVRCSFQRPDRDTGEVSRGFGRWWFVQRDITESGLVKTAYAAARMIVEHELMEAFRFRDSRVFDPHHTVGELAMLCDVKKRFV